MSLVIVLRLDATLGWYKGRTSCLDISLYNNEMMMPTTQCRNVLDIVITNVLSLKIAFHKYLVVLQLYISIFLT